MTNLEMKKLLERTGASESEIEEISQRFQVEKISEIVEAASNPVEAFTALHDFYPELEVTKLQEQMDFIQGQVEAAVKGKDKKQVMELTEEELSCVNGGGLFSWVKDNWKAIAVGAAIVVGSALICTGIGAGIGALVTSSVTTLVSTPMVSGGVACLALETVTAVTTYAGTGAVIGAVTGTVAGGVTTGVLAANGTLSKI